jgi:hypothetical protein
MSRRLVRLKPVEEAEIGEKARRADTEEKSIEMMDVAEDSYDWCARREQAACGNGAERTRRYTPRKKWFDEEGRLDVLNLSLSRWNIGSSDIGTIDLLSDFLSLVFLS